MYTEKVMDHFEHPRNVGEIENASGMGTVGNAKCGDIMRIYLDIDENGIINDVKFKTFGCGAAVATSSMATEMVKGKSIQEAMEVTNKAVCEALDGLPPVKVHCSLLAEEAIHAALWDYAQKNGIEIQGLKKPKSDIGEEEVEEERRLCYVGITRAEKQLFLSNAKMRTIYGHTVSYPPSRFLQEVPRNLVTVFQRPALERRTINMVEAKPQKRSRDTNWFLGGQESFIPKQAMSTAGAAAGGSFKAGDKVSHAKWGVGTVVSVTSSQDGQEVKIAVAGAGIRSLLTKYAVLKKL